MDIYTLKLPGDGNAAALRLDFDAKDAAEALVTAHRKASDVRARRAAELWQGTRRLCTIQHGSNPGEKQMSMRFQNGLIRETGERCHYGKDRPEGHWGSPPYGLSRSGQKRGARSHPRR